MTENGKTPTGNSAERAIFPANRYQKLKYKNFDLGTRWNLSCDGFDEFYKRNNVYELVIKMDDINEYIYLREKRRKMKKFIRKEIGGADFILQLVFITFALVSLMWMFLSTASGNEEVRQHTQTLLIVSTAIYCIMNQILKVVYYIEFMNLSGKNIKKINKYISEHRK